MRLQAATQVLQRIYLFSDSQGDVDPEDVIDLKDVAVAALADAFLQILGLAAG